MNTDECLRVLYVDDDRDSFEMLKVLLGLSQIEVDSASTVAEAMAHARANQFDLYLLDSGLPDGSGLGLCRMLRSVYPTVPVVFYSGNAHLEDIEMGMAAGAAGYITKPHSDRLAATILQLVTNYRERRRPAFTDFRVLKAAA